MLSARPQPANAMAVSKTERAFYVELGQRIAALRRDRGLTQVQLAETMGVAQQTLAHYEAGRLRLLVGALPNLADRLEVSVEELVGTPPARKGSRAKRGRVPKFQQQLERVNQLPRAKQQFVMQMLDTVLQQQTG